MERRRRDRGPALGGAGRPRGRGAGCPARPDRPRIAGYGYVWGGAHDGEQVTAAQAAKLAGKHARWSARDGEWSARLGDGTRLHWSDARSWRARTALATELRMHGTALWSLALQALPSG